MTSTNTELKHTHTSGEWSFFQVSNGPYKGQILIQSKTTRDDGRRYTSFIAEALVIADRVDEATANAKLIASAPDLL